MGVHETKTFKSGNSEAVRIPKGMAYGAGTAVRLERNGATVVITPVVEENPEESRRQLVQLIDDLRAIGRPGEAQEREPLEASDRPDLY